MSSSSSSSKAKQPAAAAATAAVDRQKRGPGAGAGRVRYDSALPGGEKLIKEEEEEEGKRRKSLGDNAGRSSMNSRRTSFGFLPPLPTSTSQLFELDNAMFGRIKANAQGQAHAPSNEPSLATHYIPDKLVTSPSQYGGAEARKQSRIAVGGLGAAAGRRTTTDRSRKLSNQGLPGIFTSPSKTNFHATTTVNEALPRSQTPLSDVFHEVDRHDGVRSTSPYPALDSATPHNAGLSYATTSSSQRRSSGMPRMRKQGAGRSAWGQNGGGHAALGAGGYESDEGVEFHDTFDGREHDEAGDLLTFKKTEERPHEQAPSYPRENTAFTASPLQTPTEPAENRRTLSSRFLGFSSWTSTGKWNQFKWCLFLTNLLLSTYALAGFVAVMLTWANFFPHCGILFVVNKTELILGTIAMILCLITAVTGWAGILLNNRAFLAVYAYMLWISFVFIVAPGYVAYKKRTFNLSGKMNRLWSQELDLSGRRTIQTILQCCGYYSPFIEAASDGNRCYARSALPGCKGGLVGFERRALQYVYISAFSTVPAHLLCIIATMLCANHITYRFGKGITPPRYRVDDKTLNDVFRKTAFDLTMAKQQQHLLFVDDISSPPPLNSPRPAFWQDNSTQSSPSKEH